MSYESRIRRRSELARFLDNEWDGRILEGLLDKERRQQVAQMACRAIGFHVARATHHASWVRLGAARGL